MNYTQLINLINNSIQSGVPKNVTSAKLRQALLDIAQFSNETRGDYQGTAAPSDNPGTPTTPVYFFATTSGTYTNFGGLVVDSNNGINILSFVPGGGWSKVVVGNQIDLSNYVQKEDFPSLFNFENNLGPGKNILNKNDIKSGRLQSDGSVLSTNNWIHIIISNFIKPNQQYTLSGAGVITTEVIRFVFYNSSNTVISTLNSNGTGVHTITTPSGTEKIGVNLINLINIGLDPTDNAIANTAQLEEGANATIYEGFGIFLNANKLSGISQILESNEIILNLTNGLNETSDFRSQISRNSFNLFNKNEAVSGYVRTDNGLIQFSVNWISSGFISIQENKVYSIQGFGAISTLVARIAWYDENKGFISSIIDITSGNKQFTSPANAKFARVTITNEVNIGVNPTDNQFSNQLMFNEGSFFLGYEDFEFIALKSDKIDGFNDLFKFPCYYSYNPTGFNGHGQWFIYVQIAGQFYARFQLIRVNNFDSNVYSNQWRIFDCFEFQLNNNVFFPTGNQLLFNGDSEGVYRTWGKEWSGGFHGNETLIFAKFYDNGKEIKSLANSIPLKGCDHFTFLQKSNTHEGQTDGVGPNPLHPIETERDKKIIFSKGGYEIFNRWKWINTPHTNVVVFYHALTCTHKDGATEGYTDKDFTTINYTGSDDLFFGNNGDRLFTANNPIKKISTFVSSQLLKPEGEDKNTSLHIWDRVEDSKYYRQVNNLNFQPGDIIESIMEVRWSKELE